MKDELQEAAANMLRLSQQLHERKPTAQDVKSVEKTRTLLTPIKARNDQTRKAFFYLLSALDDLQVAERSEERCKKMTCKELRFSAEHLLKAAETLDAA